MSAKVCAHIAMMVRTYTWGGAKIQQDLALLEEAIFLVELDQLEGGTSSVTLFFGELVPLVKTTFSVLLLDRHDEKWRWSGPIILAVSDRVVGGGNLMNRKTGSIDLSLRKNAIDKKIVQGYMGAGTGAATGAATG